MLAVTTDPHAKYPSGDDWFSPAEAYPEYRHGHLSAQPNHAYEMLRRTLSEAGLDAGRFGSRDWNPLGQWVKPGQRVFVLCNFVYHRRPVETEADFFAKCIHGSVLRAIVDYLLIAVGPTGRVAFGNSPLQGADWNAVLRDTGAARALAFWRRRGQPVRAVDLRHYVVDRTPLGYIRQVERRGQDGQGAVEVDLGDDSLLGRLGGEGAKFRVMDYDSRRTEAFHAGRTHKYVINREIMDADVVLSLSKLKTHEKVGMTCGLKGFVGTVAHKDCLAHHRMGSTKSGGDEYPAALGFLEPLSQFQDWLFRRDAGASGQRVLETADRTARRLLVRAGLRMAGAWSGNDTAWRMTLDLAHVVRFADAAGKLHREPQRVHLSLIDGIIGGEKDGPLAPSPVDAGILLFGDDVALTDRLACRAMGLDPQRIPLIREAISDPDALRPQTVVVNGSLRLETELEPAGGRPFEPAPGWREHLADRATPVARARARRYAAEIRARAVAYSPYLNEKGRAKEQLKLLNAAWSRTCAETPRWREAVERGELPAQFGSLDAFTRAVPVMDKDTIRASPSSFASDAKPGELVRMTGGSTSEPIQLPAWQSEYAEARADQWWGRSWWGVHPDQRLFLLWGHAHLLGTGLSGKVKALKRTASDRVLGYHRQSAYDLQPAALRAAAERLQAFGPDYVIGYSVALDRFARELEGSSGLRQVGVRAVFATAEAFPASDSRERLERLFGCPVTMEYGCVETGPMAYEWPSGGYRVFWRSFLLEAIKGATGRHRLYVTSLRPRAFPLVRYDLGDEVELGLSAPDHVIGLDAFERIIGRCNDRVTLADGAEIHSEVFSHAVRPVAEIKAFQVIAGQAGLRLRVTGDVPAAREAEILGRLAKVHPELGRLTIERADELQRTIAGKTPMVLHER